MKLSSNLKVLVILIGIISIEKTFAQTNESSVTNSAAPSASSVTTGGTNINYQTNNAYNNEMGFGGGVFCRTPTLYLGGNAGKSDLDSFDGVTDSGNITDNFSVNAGILFPFGSSVQKDCKKLAATITLDRMISSELSMLKACNELHQKNIPVDPKLFPLLEKCSNYKPKEIKTASTSENDKTILEKEKPNKVIPKNEKSKLIPKSFRAL